MITASIVLYKTNIEQLKTAVQSYNPSENRRLYLVDNSPEDSELPSELKSPNVEYVFVGKNLGYGAGHNIAIKKAIEVGSEYHVVLNPDLRFESSVIDKLKKFADENPSVGHLMPKILNPDAEIQYLCKLIPTPFDLIFKRFLPGLLKEKLSYRFQLKFTDYNHVMDIPYLSGCFMFFRTSALKEVDGFDERFFMYPEDIDITRRIHQKFRTVYYPMVRIYHEHAAESYKSKMMLKIHIENMCRYFNKWGWFFDSERRKVNKQVLKDLNWKELRRTKS